MARFTVGEEVRFDGEIYVISARSDGERPRYRLLASRPGGTRFAWVYEEQLSEIDSYLRARDDTNRS